MKPSVLEKLERLHACHEALEWLKTQKDLKTAWKSCERSDWMLWLLGNTCGAVGSDQHRHVVLTSCAVARTSLKFIQEENSAAELCIVATEQWALEPSEEAMVLVRIARYDADDAAVAAVAVYAAAAVYAVAVYAAAVAAVAAAGATHTAFTSNQILRNQAEIIRRFFPEPPRF